MKRAPLYYSIRLYGCGPFPKFIDSFKTMGDVAKWLKMAKSDGYHTAEVLRDKPAPFGFVGITREVVKTIYWS